MRQIHRARLCLVAASIAAIGVVAFELPVSTLLHQRSDIASASMRLSAIDKENVHLRAAIASLQNDATVAAVAHADYGLIEAGQLAFAILPKAGSSGEGTLASTPIAKGDLVADTASPFGPTPSPTSSRSSSATSVHASLWARLLGHLEFWRGTA